METELLRKIINVYMDKHEFIPFVIKNYIEGTWCLYSKEDQLLIYQLIKDKYISGIDDDKWCDLCWWMSDNIKVNDITWDSSK